MRHPNYHYPQHLLYPSQKLAKELPNMRHKLLLSRIKSSLSTDWSLNASEVEARQIEYGNNDIIEVHVNRWLELIIDTAKDPMIWFLIGASILFTILKNYNQAIILFLATIPLIGMDAFLHWRTQVSTRSLSSRLASYATVIRNGVENKITAREIVPGDLVVIPTGTSFPADGIIIAGKDLKVDESTLTGEAFPVQKHALKNILTAETLEPFIESESWGFAGTRLLSGRALLRVVYTGRETLYGEIIISTLKSVHTKTPLQKTILKLVLALIVAATILCIILAFIRYWQGFGFIDAILSAATLAVAALPDEFPVVFTFFLGIGVYRLAKQKALVRRAVSVENIGRITCICSDKTGTITEGRFQLIKSFLSPAFSEQQLLYFAAIASRYESGDPLDLAIFEKLDKLNLKVPKRTATFPFTEIRKRETSIIVEQNEKILAAVKGSPETIFALCALSNDEKERWTKQVFDFASTGYKVLACAQCVLKNTSSLNEPESGFQLVGLLIFTDPPRKEVPEAIQRCLNSGIHVLMITGDHPETARAAALAIGLGGKNPKVILAEEAELYWQKNNSDYFKTIDIIARAIPSQKYAIVKTLRSAGEIVATTGDGVNDVPALKASDVSIAMGERGTQSAREASDIILLDDNFSSIVNAIGEGRQLFKNLKMSYKYLLIVHMPFVLSAAIIPLMGFPLLYYPIHIVWIELFIHPTSMLVFQSLSKEKKLDPLEHKTKIQFFSRRDWFGILSAGFFSTIIIILSFILILHAAKNTEHARAFVLGCLSFISAALTVGLRGIHARITKIIVSMTVASAILLIQTPLLAKFLAITPLHFFDWLVISGVSLMTLLLSRI